MINLVNYEVFKIFSVKDYEFQYYLLPRILLIIKSI